MNPRASHFKYTEHSLCVCCFSAGCRWPRGSDQWRWGLLRFITPLSDPHTLSCIHLLSLFWLPEFDQFLAGRAQAADHLPSMKSSSSVGVSPSSPRQAAQEQNHEQIFRLWAPPLILALIESTQRGSFVSNTEFGSGCVWNCWPLIKKTTCMLFVACVS